jgi:hypothetical protein
MFFDMGYRNLPAKINPASKGFNSATSKEIADSSLGPVRPAAVQFHESLFAFGRPFTESVVDDVAAKSPQLSRSKRRKSWPKQLWLE